MSSSSILWFSGTGNTLLAARALANRLRAEGAEVRLVSMSSPLGWKPELHETLIFCWPVFSYGPPRLVHRFMRSMPNGENPVYMLCTMGGGAGGALANACRLMEAKGYHVLGGTELLMPNSYLGGRIPTPDSVQPLVTAAMAKVDELAWKILQKQALPWRRSWMSQLISRAANRALWLGLPWLGRSFKVSAACTGCGTCVTACPVHNISIAGRPVWGKNCEQCLRCLHSCPEAAIDFYGALKGGRPQYLAPTISVQDFCDSRGGPGNLHK